MESNKVYLGDGVYADWREDGCLILTTEDGMRITNTIYLEPEVLIALERVVLHYRPVGEPYGSQ